MESENKFLNSWVDRCVELYQPDSIVWYDGSQDLYNLICDKLVKDKVFVPLNQEVFPNSFLARSNPNDVARIEDRTFICSKNRDDAGPTNNWAQPDQLIKELNQLMAGCMRGRTMYIVPYLMGMPKSPYARFGVEVTDSEYVVANMHIMTLTGQTALSNLDSENTDFVRGAHSTGMLDPEKRYIAHFPEDRIIISFNTNYGGNVLQGKKCFALRLASVMGKEQGWLAEHMLILGITNPEGKKHFICAAFPSACGKTNLAMLEPPEEYLRTGWKIETVGDDIAWLHFGEDGRLYAINPERGFFGVVPGTSKKNNHNALKTLLKGNTIFTNTAYDPVTNTPWWDKTDYPAPDNLINWKGEVWDPTREDKAAHPNSRFTTPAQQCPCISDRWQDPQGVPISAIVFGGRRSKSCPLVYEAFNWQHAVFIGATMASETTAAAVGRVGVIRRDPMAMRPFIGYHVGDYFRHWLEMGTRKDVILPKVFHVNWFRTDKNNNFLWPGFGENIRVLEWIVKRVENLFEAEESPLGYLPYAKDLNLEGLSLTSDQLYELLKVNPGAWKEDIESQKEFLNLIGDRLPNEILKEHEKLIQRLGL